MSSITARTLHELLLGSPEDVILIDVREPFEFEDGHIPGAHNIPTNALPSAVSELKTYRDVYVYCRSGGRSARACAYLTGVGVNAVNLEGGIIAWNKEQRES